MSPPTLPLLRWHQQQSGPGLTSCFRLLATSVLTSQSPMKSFLEIQYHFKSSSHHFLDDDNPTQSTQGRRPQEETFSLESWFLPVPVLQGWGWGNRTQQRKHKEVLGWGEVLGAQMERNHLCLFWRWSLTQGVSVVSEPLARFTDTHTAPSLLASQVWLTYIQVLTKMYFQGWSRSVPRVRDLIYFYLFIFTVSTIAHTFFCPKRKKGKKKEKPLFMGFFEM